MTELDRLGNTEEATKFFLVTLLISLVLLYRTLRDWKLTFALLGQTLWAINLSGAIIKWSRGGSQFHPGRDAGHGHGLHAGSRDPRGTLLPSFTRNRPAGPCATTRLETLFPRP